MTLFPVLFDGDSNRFKILVGFDAECGSLHILLGQDRYASSLTDSIENKRVV